MYFWMPNAPKTTNPPTNLAKSRQIGPPDLTYMEPTDETDPVK